MSNREDGDAYAKETFDRLNLIDWGGYHWKLTKSSGSVHGDCDLALADDSRAYFRIDCKHRQKPLKRVSVPVEEIRKAWVQAATDGCTGAIVTNVDDEMDSAVVMPLTAFIQLLTMAYK